MSLSQKISDCLPFRLPLSGFCDPYGWTIRAGHAACVARPPDRVRSRGLGGRGEVAADAGGLPYLNEPADMAVAGFKPFPFVSAGKSGRPLPNPMISIAHNAGQEMAQRLTGGLVKPLYGSVESAEHEQDQAGRDRGMHGKQEPVQSRRRVRLTVADRLMYSTLFESWRLDWRHDLGACRYQVAVIPVEVARQVRRLVAVLRLRYAALDFAVDPAGRWWFLEVKVIDQSLSVGPEAKLPISAAVATALRLRPRVPAAIATQIPPCGAFPGDTHPEQAVNNRPAWIGGGRRGA